MSDNSDYNNTFGRRAVVIGAIQGGLLTVLAGRLAWLQVVHGHRYKTLSDKNSINIKALTPSRGNIVDRNDVPIAVNSQNFRVLVIPEQTENLELSLDRLGELASLTAREKGLVLKTAKRTASFVPLEVKDNLSWDEVAKVEVNLPDLPGVSIDVGEIRNYPLGAATSHLAGYVGAVTRTDLNSDNDPVLTLPGFKIGKTGIEKSFDKELRGKAGTSEVEVNVRGRQIRELKRYPSQSGKTIKLTIDSKLQTYVQKRLENEKSATAVIMDAQSGAVYSLVSSPAFDPNLMTRGISAEQWEELLADPGLPLNNKAVSGQYPPGSTFKMVTAIAALEEGFATRNTSVYCPGHFDYGDSRFHCWKWGGHGKVDVLSALAESCDTYFYKLAKDVGIDIIAKYARYFGFGEKTGIGVAEERSGLMPDKDWKLGRFGELWQPGETLVASIGQGYILATPLQLAVMTARIVNGGYAIKPWVTAFIGDEPHEMRPWERVNVSKSSLDLMMKGMERVTSPPKGTAHKSQIPEKALRMGGKTGTSQVRRITMQERIDGLDNKDLPWRLRHHALFVGYAPLTKPRYVCAVVVEHGGGGSTAAAPIARDILYQAQKLDPAATSLIPESVYKQPMRKPVRKPRAVDVPGNSQKQDDASQDMGADGATTAGGKAKNKAGGQ